MNIEDYKKRYKEERFYQEVFEQGMYNPVLSQDKFNTIIDVGALAGEFGFWLHDKAKEIYAIEPEPSNYIELVSNISNYGFTKVKPFLLALGGENRRGHITNAVRGGGTLSEDETKTDKDVDVKTLATFMKENNIDNVDILKIDIENGEKAVFNTPDFDTVAHKIRYIIGEHVGITSDERLLSLGFIKETYEHGFIYKRI